MIYSENKKRTFSLFINFLSSLLNHIAAYVLVTMMFLTAFDVILRFIFNSPIPGTVEIVQYSLPIVITFGFARCAIEKGHVNVEVLISKLSGRKKAFINIIIYLFFFILSELITWQTFLRTLGMAASGLKSEVLSLPIFPFILMVSLGFGVLCLVILKEFFKSFLETLR